MKIGVWILSDYTAQIGGGFALYDKLIKLIDDYNFSPGIEICFVGYGSPAKYKFKKDYIQLNKIKSKIENSNNSFLTRVSYKIINKLFFSDKKEHEILLANSVDILYYPVQAFAKLPDFPFIATNWDLGHKSSFAFPEVAMNGEFIRREKWYSDTIFNALMVFAESEAGKAELIKYLGLNPERIGIVPLFPGGVIDLKVDQDLQLKKLEQYKLKSGQFFFYPAQFWAHKNHYTLLVAFQKILSAFPSVKFVFTGSDKGNKSYIDDTIKKLNIGKNIVFPGFVDNDTIYTFYRHAAAMIMPSLIGPTNMPLLEARALNCPVLCTDLAGHREIMKDGAVYFDAYDHRQISNAMELVLDPVFKDNLLNKAKNSLIDSEFTADVAIKAIDNNFIKIKSVRNTWGKS